MQKASRNYNIAAMTFDLLGVTFSTHGNLTGLNDSQKHALLVGYANIVVDSIASLTTKAGFTRTQRIDRLRETCASLNDGTYKHERKAGGGGISTKVVLNLLDIQKKFLKQDYEHITEEEATAMRKYDADLYNDWAEWVELNAPGPGPEPDLDENEDEDADDDQDENN